MAAVIKELQELHASGRFSKDEPVAACEKITGTAVVRIDEGKLPVRANERVTEDEKKSYDRVFRDSKVATVAAVEVDKEGKAHCTKTSYVTGIEHADEFFPRIGVELSRRSADLAALVLVILGDGAHWIWERVAQLAELGQKVWQILDFWHACEHLGTISKVLYGEGSTQFKRAFKRWRSLLRKGCVAAVIKEPQELHASGRFSKQQCYELQAVLRAAGRDQLLHGQPGAHGLHAVSVVRSADRQRSSRGGLQERGRQAYEAEWHVVVVGGSQGDAPAPRLGDEPSLLGRLRRPAPPVRIQSVPVQGCLTTTLAERTPSQSKVDLARPGSYGGQRTRCHATPDQLATMAALGFLGRRIHRSDRAKRHRRSGARARR